MKSAPTRAHPWVYVVVGAAVWFGVVAVYGLMVNA